MTNKELINEIEKLFLKHLEDEKIVRLHECAFNYLKLHHKTKDWENNVHINDELSTLLDKMKKHLSNKSNPLKKGKSKKVISENIRSLIHEGYPQRRAIAISMKKAGMERKKANPSKEFDWESKETILDLAKFFHKKFPSKTIKEISKEIADSIDDNGRYSSYGDCAKVEVDGEEFNLIPNFDEFHSIAYDYVKQMLEDEPELFSKDWLNNHTYITDTDKRIIAGEEAEAYTGNLDEDEIKEKYEEDYGEVLYDGGDEHISIGSYTVSYDVDGKEKDEEADKIAAEWHGGQFTELYKLSSSGMVDSKEDLEYEIEKCIEAVKKAPHNYEKGEEERLDAFLYWAQNEVEESEPDYDKMREQIYDDHYDYVYGELESDPMNYFVHEIGAYTEEEYLKASFVSFDIEAATEDALRTDGEAHFLSHYDGKYEETDNGIIVMKE